MNLPSKIATAKGTITYTYDAAGNKLKKVTVENPGAANANQAKTTTTTYLGGFVYEQVNAGADDLQFLAHEEGRMRPVKDANNQVTAFNYDYFLKDHLGNVRMVLSEEQKPDFYFAASMETAAAQVEEAIYSKLPETRVDKPNAYPLSNLSQKVAKVRGDGQKIGPGIVLKVMAGDKFNASVESWYALNGSNPASSANPITELAAALAGSIGGMSGSKLTATELLNSGVLTPGVTNFFAVQNSAAAAGKPKAFLNYILFDEQFKAVLTNDGKNTGVFQVGGNNQLTNLFVTDREITKNGYLYLYVSNETPNIDVFFDNLQVTQSHGPIIEETHYYPFGLLQAGISYKSLKSGYAENTKKYNGIELENDLEIQTYDAFFRELDPQTGRWWQIDPVTDGYENLSPYASMYDNPMRYSDPLGNEGDDCCLGGFFNVLVKLADNLTTTTQKENASSLGKAVGNTLNQMGENAKARWDAGADPFHQAVANPLSLLGGPAAAIEGNALKATLGTAAKQEVQVLKAVEKYEVGTAKDLSKISVKDGLDVHHTPQSQPAGQVIKGYDKSTAPAIALPQAEHKAIPTLKGTNTAGNARQQLAKDIKDLRRFSNAPNSSLQKLIDLNKKTFPESFKK